jgi:hypothetical protein
MTYQSEATECSKCFPIARYALNPAVTVIGNFSYHLKNISLNKPEAIADPIWFRGSAENNGRLTSRSGIHSEKLRVRSASQEILRVLWNPKVHHRIHKSPTPVDILSQMNLIHTLKLYFPKTHFNIIIPSTPLSSK